MSTILLVTPISCFHRAVQGVTSVDAVFYEKIFFDNPKDNSYYAYTTYIQDGELKVSITDQNLKVTMLEFSKRSNSIRYVDAYRNFIVVEERCPGATVSYWVIKIVERNKCFELKAFPVDSKKDN